MRLIYFLLIGISFIFVGCEVKDETEEPSLPSFPSEPTEPEFLVSVIVRDAATQQSIAGASIYINGGFSGKTDQDGWLFGLVFKEGTHKIKVVAVGYEVLEDSFRLVEDTTLTARLMRKE